MDAILLYLLIGGFAGVMAGLLGVGGGLIIVPFLYWSFQQQGMAGEWLMHLAVGTSLATIVVTSLSSIWAHRRRGSVRWDLFWRLVPGIVVGVWLGSGLVPAIDNGVLQRFFAIFELLVALQMAFSWRPAAHQQMPGRLGSAVGGGVIGLVSALVGIGGGSMTVPWLVWFRTQIHQAIGTSAAVGLPIALVGSAGFVWFGWGQTGLPVGSSGFIYWPAFWGIVVMSALMAPVGAYLAHRMGEVRLKRLFALCLLLLSGGMFWG